MSDPTREEILERFRDLGNKIIECREILREMEIVQKDGVLLLVNHGLDVGTIAAYGRLQPFEVLSIVNKAFAREKDEQKEKDE